MALGRFRVRGVRCRVRSSCLEVLFVWGFQVEGSGFGVKVSGLQILGNGAQDSGFCGFRI